MNDQQESRGVSSRPARLDAPFSLPLGEVLVHRATVGQVAEQIRAYRRPRELRRMVEAVFGWRAFYESFLELAAETREDGWPFQTYPAGWAQRARSAVASFQSALSVGFDCHFPERASSNLRQLSQCLELAARRPDQLSGRQVGLLRRVLADSEACWGPIGSDQRAKAVSRRGEGGVGDFESAREALLQRLSRLQLGGGVQDMDSLLIPTADGVEIPPPLAERARRAWLASPRELVRTGVISSPHGLAAISSQWTEQTQRAGSPQAGLRDMVELAWSTFPYAEPLFNVVADWNRLLQFSGSAVRLPETFPATADHLHLARTTASAARGTLYERYYALPVQRLLAEKMDPSLLWELCQERARARFGGLPQPAQIAEELRILTSHGLWPLWKELQPSLDPLVCARRILFAIVDELKTPCPRKYQRWQRHKRVAHAWQRLVFFLSLAGPMEVRRFLGELDLSSQSSAVALQLGGFLQGLRSTPSPSRVLIGWMPGNASGTPV